VIQYVYVSIVSKFKLQFRIFASEKIVLINLNEYRYCKVELNFLEICFNIGNEKTFSVDSSSISI